MSKWKRTARAGLCSLAVCACGDADGPSASQTMLHTTASTIAPAVASAPRLIAPLSTLTVTNKRPRLTWALPAGETSAWVDLCWDRHCINVIRTMHVTGTHVRVPSPLATGVVFWRVRSASAEAASPIWEFFVHADAKANTAFASTADLDGDGAGDAIVAAHDGIVVVPGEYGGLATDRAAIILLPGDNHVTNTGDVNGDGIADVLITQSGTGYLFFGSPSGISPLPAQVLAVPAANDDVADDAGDFNGDGYADVVVADASNERALVHFGSPSGLDAVPPLVLAAPVAGVGFAASVAGVGDVNGDGRGDVAIGAPGSNAGAGLVYVVRGGTTMTSAIVIAPAEAGDASFGEAVAGTGDVDDDGLADLVASAVYGGLVQIEVFRSRCTMSRCAPTVLTSGTSSALFTGRAIIAGDLDGDDFADVVVAASAPTLESGNVGLLRVFLGSVHGPQTTAAATLSDGYAGGRFGQAFASPGDVDGNGRPDLLVGAELSPTSNHLPFFGAGRAYLYSGIGGTPLQTLAGESYDMTLFGMSVD